MFHSRRALVATTVVSMLGFATAPSVSAADVDIGVEVHGTDVSIDVDGSRIAQIEVTQAGGLVGLVATQSKAAFTEATLTALPASVEVG